MYRRTLSRTRPRSVRYPGLSYKEGDCTAGACTTDARSRKPASVSTSAADGENDPCVRSVHDEPPVAVVERDGLPPDLEDHAAPGCRHRSGVDVICDPLRRRGVADLVESDADAVAGDRSTTHDARAVHEQVAEGEGLSDDAGAPVGRDHATRIRCSSGLATRSRCGLRRLCGWQRVISR